MSLDRFATFTDTPEGPANDAFAIAPSDTVELTVATKAIYVGTPGHVTLRPIRAAVRRQNIWHFWRRKLAEGRPRLGLVLGG